MDRVPGARECASLAIVDFYLEEQLEAKHLDELRILVLEDLAQAAKRSDSDRKRLMAQISEVRQARYHWADMAMAKTVPSDIAQEKQQQLGARLAKAEGELARLDAITAETRSDINPSLT